MRAARIVVIDDHALFADAIGIALVGAGYEVVQIAASAEEGFRAVSSLRPDLALVDIDLPDGDGVELGKRILRELDVQVVIVSALQDRRMMRDALRAGFRGYIAKSTPLDRFVASVADALTGDVVSASGYVRVPTGTRSSSDRSFALLTSQLTPREREVLGLLVAGASGGSIARSLGISPNTVRTHVQNVLNKLQVNSRLEAASFAARHGIVDVYEQQRPLAGGA